MFAYCNNNPCSSADPSGEIAIFIDPLPEPVVEAKTSVSKEKNNFVECKTTVTVNKRGKISSMNYEKKSNYSFTYSVDSQGIIKFDNSQEMAENLAKGDVRRKLAEEMMRVAKTKVPGALEGRTISGIAFELYAHYRGKTLGIMSGHTSTTEIGGTVKTAIGYDYNADWFEHPIQNIPTIIGAFFG